MSEMVTGFINSIKNIPQSFRLADIFDILVVSFLIYLILLLLKRTHSYFIAGGMGILFVLYIIARAFSFYLTGLLFHSFFTFFIIIVVVLFQKELRHFFELISVLGRFSSKKQALSETSLDKLLAATEQLIRKKTGALIVIEGKTPIDRLLDGGIVLDGAISVPLLLSIFDPSSAGHDGAVIIHRDRIKKFGAHLPLSENIQLTRQFGTRHRAALGISERSDVLVVVISEERGTVMLAREGLLEEVSSKEDLAQAIVSFRRDDMIIRKKSLRNVIKKNRKEKVLAGTFAIALWFAFASHLNIVSNEYQVPIEFRYLSSDHVIADVTPRVATVTLSGRSQDFVLLDPEQLKLLIDAEDLSEGTHRAVVTRDSFTMPSGVAIVEYAPATIRFIIKKMPEEHPVNE